MTHPDADLFWSYLEEVVPAHTDPLWSLLELETDISKGAHTSACILEITNFVWGGDTDEDQGWLQHPLPDGRCNNTVWGEAEDLLNRGGASGTLLSDPDT